MKWSNDVEKGGTEIKERKREGKRIEDEEAEEERMKEEQ